ncbi:hypothetical protein JQ506_12990 [Shinella sp. PSBB067]|uniref:hypothetical protein n=1 Tax=Shinella sp. PSBB067 TaxID=2715959 RepID=UPI00193B6C7B|nr:hypothetical protein [Shinella sp. PSBB067]QRI61824.1 hypothetical protein JQ506_12990 [Shinella sp. PSBB067]
MSMKIEALPVISSKVSMRPLLQTVRANRIDVHWPTAEETLVIGAIMQDRARTNAEIHPANTTAALLEVLCGLPRPAALRAALAHQDAVYAMFRHAFRTMRAQMLPGDPRLAEPLPAILAEAGR